MYCRNCGNTMDENAVFCVSCGVAKGVGGKYCQNCGAGTEENAAVCIKCGAGLHSAARTGNGQKSKLVAGLLGIFIGSLGVHNFYLGYTGKAVAQLLITLLTCGVGAAVSGVWGLIEGILILTGSTITADAKGIPLAD